MSENRRIVAWAAIAHGTRGDVGYAISAAGSTRNAKTAKAVARIQFETEHAGATLANIEVLQIREGD